MSMSAPVGFAAGLLLLYVTGYLFLVPGRMAWRLAANALLGALALLAAHGLGPLWGISLGLNGVTALVAGFLGIPGVVLLAAISVLV